MSRSIYIVLSASDTLINRALGFLSKEEYPHVSIILDIESEVSYSFGRKVWFIPFIGGFIEETPYDDFHKRILTHCEVLKFEVSDKDFRKLKRKIQQFKKDSKKYHYNFMGLWFMFWNKSHKLDKRYTCTQFVASLLNSCSNVSFEKDVSLVRAEDYRGIDGVTYIYSGLYNLFFEKQRKRLDKKYIH